MIRSPRRALAAWVPFGLGSAMLWLLPWLLVAQAPVEIEAPAGLARLLPASPMPGGFIADIPRVLSDAERGRMNARIGALQDSGRGDIAVAVLRTLGDYEPYEVGVATYRRWGIGRRDSLGSARRDLGALLLLVPKEVAPDGVGHCWITTGLGAKGS